MFENVLVFYHSKRKNRTTAKVHACAKIGFDFVQFVFFVDTKNRPNAVNKSIPFLSLQIELAEIFKAANKKMHTKKTVFCRLFRNTDNKCKSKRKNDIVCDACHEMNT